MITAAIAVLAGVLSATSIPAFCAEARALLAEETAPSKDDAARALARALETTAPHVVEQADRVAASRGDLASALPVYAHAVTLLCDDTPRTDPSAARTDAAAILDDDAFAGARRGSDFLDTWIAYAREILLSFLESAGMQHYSGISRGLYLVVVTVGALLLALRVLRERRRRTRREHEVVYSVPSTHRALRTAETLLVDAEHARTRGDLKGALVLGEAALLAVLPAADGRQRLTRTHGEIVGMLDSDRARAVAPLFSLLARALFGAVHDDDSPVHAAHAARVHAFLDGVRAFLATPHGERA